MRLSLVDLKHASVGPACFFAQAPAFAQCKHYCATHLFFVSVVNEVLAARY